MDLSATTPNLIGLTRLRLMDKSGSAKPLFTDAELTDFINMAYLELVREIQLSNPYWFIKPVTFNTTTSDFYSLPTDAEGLISLEIDLNGNAATGSSWSPTLYTAVSWEQVNNAYRTQPASTYIFARFHKHLRIYPKVDSGSTGTNAGQWLYQYTPALLVNSTDEPDLPDSTHETLTRGAQVRALESLGQDISIAEVKWQQTMRSVVDKLTMMDIPASAMQFNTMALAGSDPYVSPLKGKMGRIVSE